MRSQTGIVVAKGVQHGTDVIMRAVTGRGDAGQFDLKPAQLNNPLPQVNQLSFRDLMRAVQIGALRALKRQQCLDIGQRQAQIPAMTNELQPVQGTVIIPALIAHRSMRFGQQAFVLVKPNCGDFDPGSTR